MDEASEAEAEHVVFPAALLVPDGVKVEEEEERFPKITYHLLYPRSMGKVISCTKVFYSKCKGH
jgi:hypothetical protein